MGCSTCETIASTPTVKYLSIPRSASRSLAAVSLSLECSEFPHPSLDRLYDLSEVNVVLKDPVKWYISFWAKSRTGGALLDWGLEYDDIETDLYRLLHFSSPKEQTVVVKNSCSGWLESDSQKVYYEQFVSKGLGFYTFCIHKMCAYGKLPTKLNVVRIEELTTTPSNAMNTADVKISRELQDLICQKDSLMVKSYNDRLLYFS